MLEGRGLFYGAANARGGIRIFSAGDWAAACQRAHSWGIQWVHPKVANGPIPWYDQSGLQMLRDTAHRFGLKCAPYHYVYGKKYPYGSQPDRLVEEAQVTARLASFFDAYLPDMEVEWDNHPDWAIQFGQIVRQSSPKAELYPNLFADPHGHPTPYKEILAWSNGWMPMVYFDVWTQGGHPMTAAEAISFVFPQWDSLDQQCRAAGQPSRPILPIIELGDHLPAGEVQAWLTKMQDYGYCAFWYDGVYTPYADTILKSPLPRFKTPVPPPPVPAPPPQQPVSGNGSLVLPNLVGLTRDGTGQLKQAMNEEELRFLWHFRTPSATWAPAHMLCAAWIWLHLERPDLFIGSPTADEVSANVDGLEATILTLDSGRRLIYFPRDGRVVLH